MSTERAGLSEQTASTRPAARWQRERASVGNGKGKGEKGDVALGVEGAVDRVADDAPGLAASEDPLAELFGDEREVLFERLEPVHDCGLGRRVDRGRVVAALALGEHRLALDAGR